MEYVVKQDGVPIVSIRSGTRCTTCNGVLAKENGIYGFYDPSSRRGHHLMCHTPLDESQHVVRFVIFEERE